MAKLQLRLQEFWSLGRQVGEVKFEEIFQDEKKTTALIPDAYHNLLLAEWTIEYGHPSE